MVFQVPASKASIKQNVFEFQIPGKEKVWSLPKAQYLRADLMTEMKAHVAVLQPILEAGGEPTKEQAMALEEVQTRILTEYCPGLLAEITSEQVPEILKAWQAFSRPDGVGLGESSASSDS